MSLRKCLSNLPPCNCWEDESLALKVVLQLSVSFSFSWVAASVWAAGLEWVSGFWPLCEDPYMTVTYTQFLLMNWTTTPSLLRPLQAPRNAAVSVYPWIPSCCMTDRSYCPTIVSARCGEFLKIVMSPFRVAFLEKGKSALVGPSRHSWNSRVLLLPSHYILMSPAVVKGDMGIYLIWRLHKLPSCMPWRSCDRSVCAFLLSWIEECIQLMPVVVRILWSWWAVYSILFPPKKPRWVSLLLDLFR
jgi:hypothetical protein